MEIFIKKLENSSNFVLVDEAINCGSKEARLKLIWIFFVTILKFNVSLKGLCLDSLTFKKISASAIVVVVVVQSIS